VLVRYPSCAKQAEAVAALVAGQLAAALQDRGRARLAVPGGQTPGAFLKILSGANIAWENIDIITTDERLVSESSSRSNAGMLRRTLLKGAAGRARFLSFAAAKPKQIGPRLSALLPLDVCVLGMGADGHIASLFPKATQLLSALAPDCAAPLMALDAPGAPEPRLSLTAPVILGARHLHLLLAGREKMTALTRAQKPGSVADAPVRLVLKAPQGVSIHYTDGG